MNQVQLADNKITEKRRWSPEAKPEHLSKLFSQSLFLSLQVASLLFGAYALVAPEANDRN